MVVFTACAIISLCWLCYRFYKFLTIPVIKIVSTLKIRTPPATKVSIDKISKDSITIHWENEPIKSNKNGDSISHFLLYLNNLQVAIFPNSSNSLYTCCSITGLKEETQYQLDFITVNRMGFINKLPSLYCMTNSTEEKEGSSALKKSGKWRRNTLAATTSLQDPSLTQPNNVNFSSPAYASLTALQDLESYSIEDLKKILVCAQEDLHEVLSQQASLFQDFKESKLQLELELDNLRNYWSHEIDLRKSLKSNIKSLENSKLLSDLKVEKLNKNIEQSKNKISRMERDMETWSQEDLAQYNTKTLDEKYIEMLEKLNEDIVLLSGKVKTVQQEVSSQEEKNKKLNSLKKSSNTSKTVDSNAVHLSSGSSLSLQASNSPFTEQDTSMTLSSLLKNIIDHTNEKSGMLDGQGEDTISRLDHNNQAVKLVRDQLRLDQELDNKWKSKRNRMLKRIETLEKTFSEFSMTNRQLRANLIAQPYSAQNGTSSDRNPPDNLTESVSPGLNSPPLSTRSLIDSINNPAIPLATGYSGQINSTNANLGGGAPNLILHNPSTYASNKPVPAAGNHLSLGTDSHITPQVKNDTFTHGSATTATILTNATASDQIFGWNHEQEQHQQSHRQDGLHTRTDLDQPLEYDDASHLISGLQDMIYDETDYPETISNYSKGFTTAQLDNYWATQRNFMNNTQMAPSNFSSSAAGYVNDPASSFQFGASPSNLGQTQSLLAATLAENSLNGFRDGVSDLRRESFGSPTDNTENESARVDRQNNSSTPLNNDNDNNSINGVLSQHIQSQVGSTTPLDKESSFSLQDSLNLNEQNSANPTKLLSPKHSFIWHASHGTIASSHASHSDNTHHQRHFSNASNGSNTSTWSKLNWKNWSPQNQHPPEEAIIESSAQETPSSAHHKKNSTSSSGSNGRRMSKLLSRSGVNSIFKLPSHEEKKSDSSIGVNE